jgi:hypothetical protein
MTDENVEAIAEIPQSSAAPVSRQWSLAIELGRDKPQTRLQKLAGFFVKLIKPSKPKPRWRIRPHASWRLPGWWDVERRGFMGFWYYQDVKSTYDLAVDYMKSIQKAEAENAAASKKKEDRTVYFE